MGLILEPRLLFDASVGATSTTTKQTDNTTSASAATDAAKPATDASDATAASGAASDHATAATATANDKNSGASTAQTSDQSKPTPAAAPTPTPAATAAPTADAQAAQPNSQFDSVLFVDPRVSGWQTLANSVSASTKVVVIDPTLDGVSQVTKALDGLSGIKEVDFLTYGQSGQIELGSSMINDATLQARAHDVAGWRNSFADNAQLQFWGCDVGAGDAGAAFVNDLHALVGVGVAASVDATGVASLSGDWTLERTAGLVDQRIPFSADAVAAYSYVLDTPIPTVTISGPTDVLLGNTFTETVSFQNTAASGVGYGPFIEVYVPSTTGTGASELATLTSASYLGASVSFQSITLSDQIAGHVGTLGAINPLVLDSSGNATFVAAPTGFKNGDTLYVLTLPFGSFTPGQPRADITLNFTLDNRSDLTNTGGLKIAAIGGFQYGADALNNPGSDPSIRGTAGTPTVTNAGDGLVTASTDVKLIDVTTQVNTYPGEGETATGPTFPGSYQITLTPASAVSGDPLTNFDFTLNLPTDVQYNGGTISISGGGTATIVPNSGSPGGVLKVHFASLSSAQTISIPIFVPQADSSSAQVLDPSTGAPQAINLTPTWTYAANNWTPVSGAFHSTPQAVSDSGDGTDPTFTAKSFAVQVSDSVSTDTGATGFSPGDIVKYTINFQVSDYFDLSNLVLADLLGDGMTLLPGTSPTLDITNNGTTTHNISFGSISDPTTTINGQQVSTAGSNTFWNYGARDGSGQTAINFSVGALLQSALGSSTLTGNSTTGTQGTVTFYAQVLDKYTNINSGNSIRENDSTSDSVTGSGTVTSHATSQSHAQTDSSSVSNQVAQGNMTLAIAAVNGTAPGSTVTVHPGDLVTYTMTYNLTSGDFGNLNLNAFLPLPVYAVPGTLSAGNGTDLNTYTVVSNPSGNTPVVTTNATANSIGFNFGTYDSTSNAAGQKVTVTFTLRASSDPFADGLQLTTQGQTQYTNAAGSLLANATIKQQVMAEPQLVMKTGVVSVVNDAGGNKTVTYSGDTGSSTADPTTIFNPAGSSTTFVGSIPTSIGNAENQNVSGVDGGDTVRVTETVQNTGSNSAYDVVVRGTLPSGYSASDITNLKVTRGDGTVLTYTGDASTFFSATGITINGSGGTTATPALKAAGDASHADILYVTYDLAVKSTQAAATTLTAGGSILQWAGADGGTGFVTNGTPVGGSASNLTDNATITTTSPTFTKAITAGDDTTNVALNSVVVGETITYTFTLTVPEGTMNGVTFSDVLPSYLTNISLGTPTLSTNVTSTASMATALSLAGNTISGNFGNITNANADATGTLTFTVTAKIADSTNANGTSIANTGTVNWSGPTLTGSATATEVDPHITETLSNNASGSVHSGQTVTYTLTLKNDGTAPAQDISEAINLPSGLTFVANSITQTGGSTSGVTIDNSGKTVSVTQIPVGSTLTFTFQATVDDNLSAGTNLQVTAPGTYTSMPGAVTGERTYNATGNSTVSIATFAPSLVIVDQSNGTSATDGATAPSHAAPTASADGVIGEVVRMRAYVQIPEGQNPVSLQVNLPSGLEFLNDSGATTVNFYSPDGSITSSVTAVNNITGLNQTDTAGFNPATAGNPTGTLPGSQIAVGAGTVTFDFGTLTNNANSTVPNYAVVEFNAVVKNVAGNHSGTSLASTVQVGSATSSSATVTVKEPTVTITKTIDSIDQATGDVTWKVVVSNTGNTKAYDVSLNDAEPGGANESTLFNLSQTGSASNLNVTSGNGTTALIATMDLGAGLSETFTYKTTVTNRAAPVADATATLSYTSLNDNTAFSGTGFYGSTYTAAGNGSSGSSTGERTGSDGVGGALNNYAANATVGIRVAGGNVWQDMGSPLNAQDQGLDSGADSELAGVSMSGSWTGQVGGASSVSSDANGDYSFLLPDNVTATIAAPTTFGGSKSLVYDTDGTFGTSFNHSESGLSSAQAKFSLTAGSATAFSGINFAYRAPDTAPVITNWPAGTTPTATTTGVSLSGGSTGVSDAELDTLVANSAGDYSGTTLTIQRHGSAVTTDAFVAGGSATTGLFFSNGSTGNGNVLYNGAVIGTYTESSTGILTITFASGSTAATVKSVLDNVQYSTATGNKLGIGLLIDATLTDHNTETGTTAGNAYQGTGGVKSTTVQAKVNYASNSFVLSTFAEPNDAPPSASPTTEASSFTLDTGSTFTQMVVGFTGFIAGEDVLIFTNNPGTMGNIQGVWNATTGTLTLTSAGNTATTAQWQAAVRGIQYYNASDTPTVGNHNTTITATTVAGDTATANFSANNVSARNDSPILNTGIGVSLSHGSEDSNAPSGAVGTLVSSLIGNGTGPSNVTDPDHANSTTNTPNNATVGIAVTSVNTAHGTWWYSTDNGTTWTQFTITGTNALHLVGDSNTRVFFQSTDPNWNGTIANAMTFRAWDQYSPTTAPANGTIADIGSSGFGTGNNTAASAYSSAVDTVSLTVDAVNDAPVASGSSTLPSIPEDTANPSGDTVSNLFTPRFDDSADTVAGGSTANGLAGIAITANAATAAQGVWRYSLDGGATWNTIPTSGLGDTTAMLLPSTAKLSFLPNANWNGTPGGLTVRLIDDSSGPVTFSASSNVSSNGGITPISAATVPLGTIVTPVNDAPVVSGNATLPSVNEDGSSATGTSVSTLLGQGTVSYSDAIDTVPSGSTGTAAAGIAITGNASTAAQGTWQYSTDGGTTWNTIPTSGLSDTNALVIPLSATLRFTPVANWNGTPGSLTAHISDGDTGLPATGLHNIAPTEGGTGQWSAGTISIGITVLPVNDAPVASGSSTLPSIPEDTANPSGDTVSNLFTPRFDDSTDTVVGGSTANGLAGIAITANAATAAQGVWRYSLDGGATWNTIPTSGLGDTTAMLLPSTAKLSFLPNADWNGTPGGLTVRLIDDSSGPVTFSASSNVSSNGGITPISAATVPLGTIVTPVNDAPIISGTVTMVTQGSTVTSLITPVFSDTADQVTGGSSANTLAGIAVTGNASDPATQGVWRYSVDGGTTWTTITTGLSDTAALVLPNTAKLQFVGVLGYTGTPGALTVRGIDSSTDVAIAGVGTGLSLQGGTTAYNNVDVSGANNGGRTAVSAAAVPLNTVVSGSVTGAFIEPNDSAPINAQVAVNPTVVLNLNPAGAYTSATFRITGGYVSREDILTFTNDGATMGNIVGSFDATTGTMTLTSATATPTQWQAALRAIKYYDTSDTPSAANRVVTMNIVDSGLGTLALGTSTVTVTPVNDTPILNTGIALSLPHGTEDASGVPAGAAGFAVSTLVGTGVGPGNVTDPDGPGTVASLAGIAITAADTTHGAWWYSTDGGATWTRFASSSMTAVSDSNALHLVANANTRLYFQPTDPNWNGTIANAVTFRAWDGFDGIANGTLSALPAGLGGGINTAGSAYSSATKTLPLTVDPVNDAPIASGNATLPAVRQDNSSPPGATVSSLFTSSFDDSTDQVPGGSSANSLAGIAIVGNAATADQGTWNYSLDGGATWVSIRTTALSNTQAIVLPSTAMLQFVPSSSFAGTPGALNVRLIDSSNGAVAFSASTDVSINGGITAISAGTVQLNTTVTAVPPAVTDTSNSAPPNLLNLADTPVSQEAFVASAGFGTAGLRFFGGREPDWLVGSDVYRVMIAGQPGVANVSADVFYGSAPRQTLRFEAGSLSGGPLPPWLLFDPGLLRFAGTPPENLEGTVDVRVIATDRAGRQATAEVHIVIAREPRDIAAMLLQSSPVDPRALQPPSQPDQGNPPADMTPAGTPGPLPAGDTPPAIEAPPPPAAPPPATPSPAAPSQGALPQWLETPDRIVVDAGFGLSPQLREQSHAGRLARSRALLNALAAEPPGL